MNAKSDMRQLPTPTSQLPRHAVRAAALVAAVLAATCVAAEAQPSSQQRPSVIRSGADAVSVDVSVQRDRRPVADLTAADFELFDNGVPQQITEIAYERLPIDVTLLLDVSASVTGPVLDDLRRALNQLRADLRPGDRLRLLTFNMRVHRMLDFDQPTAGVDDALASLAGVGSSAVFDALAVAMTTPDTPGRRRLIVLFSDAQDSSSISDPDTLLDVARRSTSTVAIVLASQSADRAASLLRATPETADAFAEHIAGLTGGIVSPPGRGENLPSRFRRMLQDFRTSYVLYYTPTGVEPAGVHTIDVRVNRPDVTVRARRSYVAGE
jgi:VWFA-related protein